jgi:hypothetical protein
VSLAWTVWVRPRGRLGVLEWKPVTPIAPGAAPPPAEAETVLVYLDQTHPCAALVRHGDRTLLFLAGIPTAQHAVHTPDPRVTFCLAAAAADLDAVALAATLLDRLTVAGAVLADQLTPLVHDPASGALGEYVVDGDRVLAVLTDAARVTGAGPDDFAQAVRRRAMKTTGDVTLALGGTYTYQPPDVVRRRTVQDTSALPARPRAQPTGAGPPPVLPRAQPARAPRGSPPADADTLLTRASETVDDIRLTAATARRTLATATAAGIPLRLLAPLTGVAAALLAVPVSVAATIWTADAVRSALGFHPEPGRWDPVRLVAGATCLLAWLALAVIARHRLRTRRPDTARDA